MVIKIFTVLAVLLSAVTCLFTPNYDIKINKPALETLVKQWKQAMNSSEA